MSESAKQKLEKNRKTTLLISGALLVLISVIIITLGTGLQYDQKVVPSALISTKATDFSVKWLQGQEFVTTAGEKLTMDSIRGRPVILNFWASWCYSCRQEAGDMQAYWEKMQKEHPEVLLVGIAIQDTAEAALKFAKYYGKTYPLGLDMNGNAAIDYGIYGVPETFFVNKEGIIVHKEAMPVDGILMDKWLDKIL
jgi:cytochrome c biogenesis protein CcmG/thiol:disulfide interchange protein DsbE